MAEDVTDLRERFPKDSVSESDSDRDAQKEKRAYSGSLIKSLKCFDDVDRMVRDGAFVRDVIAFIQSRGELTNLSRDAIRYMIHKYKRQVFSGEDELVSEDREKDDGLDKEDPLAHILAIRDQFFIMRDRIKLETDVEKSLGKLFSTTHKEFLSSVAIAEKLDKLMEKRGLIDVNGSKKTKRVGSGMAGRVDLGEVVANPESRHKLIGIMDMLIENPDVLMGIAGSDDKKKKNRPKRKKKRSAEPRGKTGSD